MTYQYALYSRPADLGAVPKDFQDILPRPAPGKAYFDVARHGIICYNRELSAQEVKAFELPQLLGPERCLDVAQLVTNGIEHYARGYLKMAEQDPEHFKQVLHDQLRSNWPGYPPVVADFSRVVSLVIDRLKQVHENTQAEVARQAQEETSKRLAPQAEAQPSAPAAMDGSKASHWFALTDKGLVVSLGLNASMDEAEEALEKKGLQAIWLFDQETALEWQSVISSHVPASSPKPVATGAPRVLITVRGGVADWVGDEGVDVETFDFDNCAHCDGHPGCASKLPAHFSDLAESVDAPYEGDQSHQPAPGGM